VVGQSEGIGYIRVAYARVAVGSRKVAFLQLYTCTCMLHLTLYLYMFLS